MQILYGIKLLLLNRLINVFLSSRIYVDVSTIAQILIQLAIKVRLIPNGCMSSDLGKNLETHKMFSKSR